jgi:hypothetical protein
MPFFNNKRKDFSIQPPKQSIANGVFSVIDSANIDFTYSNNNLTANLTQTGITAGTYGDATHIPILVLDAYGRVTGISTTTFSASGILLQTNGVDNGSQTLLNLVAGTNMTITDDGLGNITFNASGGGGSGTVTSVSAGTGMNFSTITTSGAVAIDTTKVPYLPVGFSTGLLKWNGSAWVFDISTYLTTISGLNISLLTNDSGYITSSALAPYLTIASAAATYYPLTNPAGYITSAALAPYLTILSAASTYYPIPTGTTSQYIRGDGSLATFPSIPSVGTWGTLNYPTWVSGTPFVKMTAVGTFALDTNTYYPTPTGTTAQYIRGDGSLSTLSTALVAASMYQQEVYIAGNTTTSVEYVSSVNKVYVANNSTGTVSIFDLNTGDLLASVAVTNALKVKYISSINEIWVTSSTLTTITRISVSGNTSLGPIIGLTANGTDILEFSSTKVFVAISAGTGVVQVVNPSTLLVAGVVSGTIPAFPHGMALNTKVSSAQYNKVVLSASAGVAIFDPTTNAITATSVNPSSLISTGRYIVYSSTQDKYYLASQVNNRLVILSIASSTTFTATSVQNQLFLNDVVIDDTNDLLFTVPMEALSATNILVKQYRLSTMAPLLAFRTSTTGGGNTIAGYIAKDTANTRLFVIGRTAAANSGVSIIKYLV